MKGTLREVYFLSAGDNAILRNPKTNKSFLITMKSSYCGEDSNPRITPVSQMLCWCKYNLGDTNQYSSEESALYDIAERLVPVSGLLDFIREGKTSSLFIVTESREQIEVGIGEPDDFGDPKDIDDSYKIIINLTNGNIAQLQNFKAACLRELDKTDLFLLITNKAVASIVLLPILLYDHGSISLSTASTQYPYSCMFDTYCVGFIDIEKSAGIEAGLWAADTPESEWRKKAIDMLQQEVSAVEAWANGRVFNIDVRKWVGNDETDAPEDHLAEWDDLENDESFEDYSSYGDIYTWNDSDVEKFIAFIKKNLFNDSSLRDEDIEYID